MGGEDGGEKRKVELGSREKLLRFVALKTQARSLWH